MTIPNEEVINQGQKMNPCKETVVMARKVYDISSYMFYSEVKIILFIVYISLCNKKKKILLNSIYK